MIPKVNEVSRQHESHPEETEEELREHQALHEEPYVEHASNLKEQSLGSIVHVKQEREESEDESNTHELEHNQLQTEQDLLFRQVLHFASYTLSTFLKPPKKWMLRFP